MTHFVGLVVAETEAELSALLQPFHEYECTGIEDQWVKDVDITDEAREEFAKNMTECLRDTSGKLWSFFTPDRHWDTRFSQHKKNPERWETMAREEYTPPGYEKVTVPTSELEEFAQWAASYYGAEARGDSDNSQIVRRTNPDAKWDWWSVGGRWADMVPGSNCLIEDVPKHFTEWQPSVLIDAGGWHSAKEWGWFGANSPSDTPEIVAAKMTEHAGKRVWVVDFHI